MFHVKSINGKGSLDDILVYHQVTTRKEEHISDKPLGYLQFRLRGAHFIFGLRNLAVVTKTCFFASKCECITAPQFVIHFFTFQTT